jgi:hypothetical protein
MEKTKLTAMTVAELKALAKKRKVSLSEGGRKADIIGALLDAAGNSKLVAKTAAKTAAKKTPVMKAAKTKAAAPAKPAPKKAGRTAKTAVSAQRPGAARRGPARKAPEPILPVHDWKLPPGAEEPLLAQERISEAKYYTGPDTQAAVATYGELPRTYGDDRIVLMTRDPFVVHTFWEASPARLERERAWFGWNSKLCVRIYDITGVQFDGRNALGYYDQEVSEQAGNWYFDLGRPSHSFCADLGLLSPEGRFMTLVRSNYVTMPRDGVSDVIDEEWMLVDEEFWKLYGYPEGFKGGVSSPELQEMMRRRRMQEITSPGLFSRERVKTKAKRK